MNSFKLLVSFAILSWCGVGTSWCQKKETSTPNREASHVTIISGHFVSKALRKNRTGLDSNRNIKIYLPPSYQTSKKSYAVIYFCPTFNKTPEQLQEDGHILKFLELAFATGTINECILVTADYSTPTMSSWFENSSTTGRWLDYTVNELVPFIDSHFRTIKNSESRGIAGDLIGGYGALKLAMLYPDLFSVVYAMHPVGTGTGVGPGYLKPDWKKVFKATKFSELYSISAGAPFVAMAQAYLPNDSRPPFYCDFMVDIVNDEVVPNVGNILKWENEFLLDHMVEKNIANLRRLRAIGFDWGRYDGNIDHVFSNHAFTRQLGQFGIEHEAEEYNGTPTSRTWTDDGRFYTRLLPFFNKHLSFNSK